MTETYAFITFLSVIISNSNEVCCITNQTFFLSSVYFLLGDCGSHFLVMCVILCNAFLRELCLI